MLLPALLSAVLAVSATTQTRDAPWRLLSISKDQRTLYLGYEGGGCTHADGAAEVDTSAPDQVRIRVRQTYETGPYVVCPANLALYRLQVRLDAPLRGRRVTGGPRMSVLGYDEVPNVVGLTREDAIAALEGGKVTVTGHAHGVVRFQRGRELYISPSPLGAELSVVVPREQRLGPVLRRGPRFSFRANPAVEKSVYGIVECRGMDGGNDGWPIRSAAGTHRVWISNLDLRHAMRRARVSRCRLDVYSLSADADDLFDYLVRQSLRFTVRR